MKKNKIIWIIIGILLIGFIVFLVTRKEKPFNELTIPITNVVTNKTTQDYLTPIVNSGLHELKIDSVYLIIQPMSLTMKTNGLGDKTYELMASLIGNKTQYILYVSQMDRYEGIEIIAHELVHLVQFHSGKLVKWEGLNSVLWEGQIYDVSEVPYLERPWEKEAYSKDKDLAKKIRNVLLK